MEATLTKPHKPAPLKRRDTRERILAVSSQLFLEKGFSATSIEDILEKVEIAKGTFYHHFISKESLLEAVTDSLSLSGYAEVVDRLQKSKASNALARLNALFRISMEWRDENIESMIHLIRALCSETNISLKYTLKIKNRELSIPLVSDILVEGKKENIFRFENSRITAEIIMFLLEGLSDHLEKDLLERSESQINMVINHYQSAIEKVLGLESNSIRVIDWNSYQSIKEKILKLG